MNRGWNITFSVRSCLIPSLRACSMPLSNYSDTLMPNRSDANHGSADGTLTMHHKRPSESCWRRISSKLQTVPREGTLLCCRRHRKPHRATAVFLSFLFRHSSRRHVHAYYRAVAALCRPRYVRKRLTFSLLGDRLLYRSMFRRFCGRFNLRFACKIVVSTCTVFQCAIHP